MEIVRLHCDYQHQGGRGLEWSGKVNICELLINVVIYDKPKVLKTPKKGQRLECQKARDQAQVLTTHLS